MKHKNLILIFIILSLISCITDNSGLKLNNLISERKIIIDGDNIINTISNNFFGIGFWSWTPTWGDSYKGTESLISNLNINLLRYGGITNDTDIPDPVNKQEMINFDTYCRKINAEPLVQVPLAKYKNTNERKSGAVSFLDTYNEINIIKYVTVGNEPDLYSDSMAKHSSYNLTYLKGYSVNNYINDFKAVSTEIRKKYPDIKIIGMNYSNKQDWISPFIKECRDYVDIVSMHYYPYGPGEHTYNNVSASYDSIQNFYNNVRNKINKNSNGKSIPLIIGETNVSWDGDPNNCNLEASPGTFYGGLWMADFIGISTAQNNLFSIMPWCIIDNWKLGFLDTPDINNPKNIEIEPVYYIYKMFSNYCKPIMIHNEKVNKDIRIYAYKDDKNNLSIFVVNWSKKNEHNIHFTFNDIIQNKSINYNFIPSSLTCLTIDSDFSNKKAYIYSKSKMDKGYEIIDF